MKNFSKISDVYLELFGYNFFHSPYVKDKSSVESSYKSVGRKSVISRLISILKNSKSRSGAYLITGFRGMGKTSLVREVIHKVNSNDTKPKKPIYAKVKKFIKFLSDITVNGIKLIWLFILSFMLFGSIVKQSMWHYIPTDFSLLKVSLLEIWNAQLEEFSNINGIAEILYIILQICITTFAWLLLYTLFIFIINWGVGLFQKVTSPSLLYQKFDLSLSQNDITDRDLMRLIAIGLNKYLKDNQTNHLRLYITYPKLGVKLWNFFNGKALFNGYRGKSYREFYERILDKSELLIRRMESNVIETSDSNFNPTIGPMGGIGKLTIGSLQSRRELNYPILNSKEAEQELINLLFEIDVLRDKSSSGFVWTIPKLPQFIFVVDELDKIEPSYVSDLKEREKENPYLDINAQSLPSFKIRHRQEVLAKLLSNLKYFLNTARAKFIFIGGRELYDASLADIADRDTFYSSIFHEVIYIQSFLKDHEIKSGGLTTNTENLLMYYLHENKSLEINELFLKIYGRYLLLLGYLEHFKNWCNLKKIKFSIKQIENSTKIFLDEELTFEIFVKKLQFLYAVKYQRFNIRNKTLNDDHVKELTEFYKNEIEKPEKNTQERKLKIITLLQKFIIYLTYRSNGSPKKFNELVERYIVPGDQLLNSNNELNESASRNILIKSFFNDKSLKDRLFLRLTYKEQHEIGFISNLFRPYIINNSKYLTRLEDKLLVSTAYILDHVLKFHESGFSWRNLELLPEIIMVNKEPNLRAYIEKLIEYLMGRHIKITTTGLHQFKFQEGIARQLNVLSKVSSHSSAAFNFTLDESILIKRHYRLKLYLLQKDQTKVKKNYIHSIGFIQTILGDLHYNDKEYDDAILYYTDSIQSIRDKLPNLAIKHQRLILVRNELKLALALERMRAYNSAYSVLRSLIVDMPSFFRDEIYSDSFMKEDESKSNETNVNINFSSREDISGETVSTDAKGEWGPSYAGLKPFRGLQLFNAPFITLLSIIEKQRTQGISLQTINKNFEEYLKFTSYNTSDQYAHISDKSRIRFLLSDYCYNLANMLFYKNIILNNESSNRIKVSIIESIIKLDIWETKTRFEPSNFDFPMNANLLYLISYELLQTKLDDTFLSNLRNLKLKIRNHGHKKLITRKAKILGKLIDVEISSLNLSKDKKDIDIKNNAIFSINENQSQLDNVVLNFPSDYKKKFNDILTLISITSNCYISIGNDFEALFELKKSLYLIKEFKIEISDEKLIKGYKDLIQSCIDLAIKCHSGSPHAEFEKYEEMIHLETSHSYLFRNLSNSEDIREILVLDAWIKEKESTFGETINQYNSISNSFIRVSELTLKAAGHYSSIRDDYMIGSNFDTAQKDTSEADSDEASKGEVNSDVLVKLLFRFNNNDLILDVADKKKELLNSNLDKNFVKEILKPFGSIFKNQTEIDHTIDSQKNQITSSSLHAKQKEFLVENLEKCRQFHEIKYLNELKNIPKLIVKIDKYRGQIFNVEEDDFLKLLIDSIYCLYESISLIQIASSAYYSNNMILASSHHKLILWTAIFQYLINNSDCKKLEMELGLNLDTKNLYTVNPIYHAEKAVYYYNKTEQIHNCGPAYMDAVNNMYFLEDNFDDNLKHFLSSLERMNLENIKNRRDRIKLILKISSLYDIEAYKNGES